MAYDQKTKDGVRALYVYKNLDLKDCARVAEIPYNTVRAWFKAAKDNNDDWGKARNAARMGQGGLDELTNSLIENFALHTDSIFEEINTDDAMSPGVKADLMAKIADSYSKLLKTAGSSGSKVAPLSVAMTVLKLLGDYIQSECPENSETFADILSPFGRVVAKEFG